MHHLVRCSPVIDVYGRLEEFALMRSNNQGDSTVDNGESDRLFMRENVRDKTSFRLCVSTFQLAPEHIG